MVSVISAKFIHTPNKGTDLQPIDIYKLCIFSEQAQVAETFLQFHSIPNSVSCLATIEQTNKPHTSNAPFSTHPVGGEVGDQRCQGHAGVRGLQGRDRSAAGAQP